MQISDADVKQLASAIANHFGIGTDPLREPELAATLAERLIATRKGSVAEYLELLKTSSEEWDSLANRVSVPETYFFRTPEHFQALCSVAIPDRVAHNRDRRELRIASIGCASGEEPYSIAIAIREQHPELRDWKIDLVGFDISPRSLGNAAQAIYSRWSLRATSDADRERLFRSKDAFYELDPAIKNAVRFKLHNVLDLCDDPSLQQYFDIVFFRNVLIYFSPETARSAIQCIAGCMQLEAYLFIGPAETLRGLSNDFSLCHSHGIFYYRRREGGDRKAEVITVSPMRLAGVRDIPEPEATPTGTAGTWIEEIQRSSRRIGELAKKEGHSPKSEQHMASGKALKLNSALSLMSQERFQEALEMLDSIPHGQRRDPEVDILRAVLLTNAGSVQEAERVCVSLLKNDDLNASAHYLLALCREQQGDLNAAIEQDSMAAYLDPAFSMPHLHRAMMERRLGRRDAACRELAQASALLAREDASRILFFGGGFSRNALIQLCDREMRACRGNR